MSDKTQTEKKTTPARKSRPAATLKKEAIVKLITQQIEAFHKDDPEPITESRVQQLAAQVAIEAIKQGQPDKPRVFLCNVRWEHPPVGGFPMPMGMCWYGFHTFRLTESEYGAGIPEALFLQEAIAQGAGENGLTIEGISVLPEGF